MKKTILIDNETQDYSMIDTQYLSSRGIEAIPVVTAKNKAGHKKAIVVKDYSYENLLEAIKKERPDYICCYYDRFMQRVAKIREVLGLKGLSQDQVTRLIDKRYSSLAVSTKVKVPKSTAITASDNYSKLSERLSAEKIFIKPHTKSASESIYTVHDQQDFQRFLSENKTILDEFVAQEYIEAELYHVDLVVQNSEIHFISARKYSAPNHQMVAKRIPLFSLPIEDKKVEAILLQAACDVREALQYNNGVMHAEFYLSEELSPIFLEVNVRHPGIGINSLYAHSLGFSFETLMVLLESEEALPALTASKDFYLCGYFPVLPGRIVRISQPELRLKHKIKYFVKAGEYCDEKGKLSKSASVLLWDKCLLAVKDAYCYLAKHQLLQLDND